MVCGQDRGLSYLILVWDEDGALNRGGGDLTLFPYDAPPDHC